MFARTKLSLISLKASDAPIDRLAPLPEPLEEAAANATPPESAVIVA